MINLKKLKVRELLDLYYMSDVIFNRYAIMTDGVADANKKAIDERQKAFGRRGLILDEMERRFNESFEDVEAS